MSLEKFTIPHSQQALLPQPQHQHHPTPPRLLTSYRRLTFFSIFLLTSFWFTSNYLPYQSGPSNTSPKVDPSRHPPHERNPSYLVTGKNGVVASEEDRCSKIGVAVLKDNGTATDAAIATALCIGVVNSFSSGIGGGGFMIIKPPQVRCNEDRKREECESKNQVPTTIEFRETVPDGDYYREEFERDPSKSESGGLSIGIPGELAGFHAAYLAFGGGVSWKRIFEPSIQLAKNFSVGEALAFHIALPSDLEWIKTKEEWKSIFLHPDGQPAKVGEWIQRPALARTLQTIADEGIDPFYRGTIAQSLVETINREGGKVSLSDFQNYQPIVSQAINTTYHGYNIWTTGPPSSGPMLLHLMNVLERYAFHEHPRDSLTEHRFVEALKYAFSARTELGDPKFLNSTQLDRIETIKSKKYALGTSLKIDDERTYNYTHYQPKYDIVEDHGTTHLSVIDRFGSVVSLTSTVNLNFGSHVMDSNHGIILNDENDDFSIKGRSNHFDLFSSPLNYPATGKRPISSMAPIIVDYIHSNLSHPNNPQDTEFFCALGASGGSRIFSAVAGTFLKLLWGYDLSHAIEDPRLHHQLLPNQIYVETSYRPDFLNSLKSKNHKIEMIDIYYGKSAVHGIHKRSNDPILFGSSDSRKFGVPDAY